MCTLHCSTAQVGNSFLHYHKYYHYKMFLRNELHAGRITLCATSVSSSQGIARTSKNEEATIEDETDGAELIQKWV